MKFLQGVRLWNKKCTLRQILKKNTFLKSMAFEEKYIYKKHDFEEKIIFKKPILKIFCTQKNQVVIQLTA